MNRLYFTETLKKSNVFRRTPTSDIYRGEYIAGIIAGERSELLAILGFISPSHPVREFPAVWPHVFLLLHTQLVRSWAFFAGSTNRCVMLPKNISDKKRRPPRFFSDFRIIQFNARELEELGELATHATITIRKVETTGLLQRGKRWPSAWWACLRTGKNATGLRVSF